MFTKTITKDSRKVKRIRNYVSKLVLVDGSFTFSLSIRSSESFQHISSLLHLNSCKTITLAWSTPTQTYLLFAGLVNTQKMISSGFNKNALPQFGGPAINTLQNLSLSFSSKSLIASANTKVFLLFSWSTCLVHSYHSMSHHQHNSQSGTSLVSLFWLFFHVQWKPLHCLFSKCSQWDHWEVCWTWTT